MIFSPDSPEQSFRNRCSVAVGAGRRIRLPATRRSRRPSLVPGKLQSTHVSHSRGRSVPIAICSACYIRQRMTLSRSVPQLCANWRPEQAQQKQHLCLLTSSALASTRRRTFEVEGTFSGSSSCPSKLLLNLLHQRMREPRLPELGEVFENRRLPRLVALAPSSAPRYFR